jgi:hypothetical protein
MSLSQTRATPSSRVNPTISNYGADASGLISGYLLGVKAGSEAIDTEQAGLWLAERRGVTDGAPGGLGFVWLYVHVPLMCKSAAANCKDRQTG